MQEQFATTAVESHRNTFAIHVTVPLHQSVLLECSGVYMQGRKWEFENNILYSGRFYFGKIPGESFQLYDNYSLLISSMSFHHEGRYTCKQNASEVISGYHLQVEVPPRLYMTIDEVKTSNETHQIDSSKPLFVACYAVEARPAVNLTWLLNDKVLDSNSVLHEVSKSPDNNKTFDTVTLAQFRIKDEDGKISCEGSYSYAHSKFIVQANFVTYVIPETFMFHGIEDGPNIVEASKDLMVRCSAFGARPLVALSWILNDKMLQMSAWNITSNVTFNLNNNTYNSHSELIFRPHKESEDVSCLYSDEQGRTAVINTTFVTYVLPDMKISVPGFNQTNNISVTANEEVVLICAANGARPLINLTWIVEGITQMEEEDRLKESSFDVTFHADMNTYDSYSKVRYLPYEGKQIVSCIGENAFGIKERYGIALIGYDKHGDHPSRLVILLLFVAALNILIVLGVCLLIIRYKLLCGTQVSMNISEEEASKEQTSKSEKINPTLTDAVSLEDKSGVAESSVRPPNLNLPKIPDDEELSEYSCVPTEQKTYYSELKDKTTKDRMFLRKNICFILDLKMGPLYKRWMGTIDIPKKEQKCVVISTVTESVLLDSCINWSAFVQRVLELRDTDYLVRVEGICVDTVSLYLLHEHLVCETLESYLAIKEASCGAAGRLHYMKRCLLDIIKGMEHIQAFGFLHPGISMRKILVTQKGNCKLYDYCLAEDAPKKLVFLKSSPRGISVSSIPPEALQRNEYTKESDVWSLASIVSTMTVNDLYFGSCEDDIGVSEVYQRLRNNVLVDCLSTDPKLRLTVTQLRSCFEEAVQSSQEGKVPASSATNPVDVYVPMTTNITTKKETYL